MVTGSYLNPIYSRSQRSTESHGLFSGFDYNLPSYAGEVQVPALGKDISCFDKNGHPVYGQLGELVLTTRSPSFPLYLWKDEDGSVMKNTYLSKFPGTWCPGDECWINPKTRGIIIVGRRTKTTRKPKRNNNNDDDDIDNNGSSDDDDDYGDASVFCNTVTE
ncbi:acetoacetyl-CoA synthetase [Trichonephila clavipes]|nr:acetoacetyl-CoA synthetase [Trichonephila clavipes]